MITGCIKSPRRILLGSDNFLNLLFVKYYSVNNAVVGLISLLLTGGYLNLKGTANSQGKGGRSEDVNWGIGLAT